MVDTAHSADESSKDGRGYRNAPRRASSDLGCDNSTHKMREKPEVSAFGYLTPVSATSRHREPLWEPFPGLARRRRI
jgi:hypothetical protein